VLVSSGLQAPDPIVPCIVGGLVMVNAAVVAGPLGAFELVPRRRHAVLDVVLVGVIVGAAVQQWWSIDNATRLIMLGAAVVLGVVTFYTDFAERRERRDRRAAAAATGERVGRSAGRGQCRDRLAPAQAVRCAVTRSWSPRCLPRELPRSCQW
jgi:hypothetical protein